MSDERRILEFAASGPAQLKVDRTKGIIYGVKILGPESGNPAPKNYVYPKQAREQAATFMEGGRSCVDHPPDGQGHRARHYGDLLGTHRNVREQGDGLYSDFHFNPKHHLAEQLLWDAEHNPAAIGFSINCRYHRASDQGGRRCIEEIDFDRRWDSIDLVTRPGTTNGLYESLERPMPEQQKQTPPPATKTIKEMKALLPADSKARKLLEELDAAGMGAAPMPADAAANPEDAIKAAFASVMHAAIDAYAAGKMDQATMVSKIKEMAKMLEKTSAKSAAEEGSEEETATEESRKAKPGDDVKQLREELAIRDQVEEAGLKFAKPEARRAFVKSLVPLSADERKALIEERQGQTPQSQSPGTGQTGTPPRSQSPSTGIQESRSGGNQPAEDPDEARRKRVARLRGASIN